jgi:hypothetical protein
MNESRTPKHTVLEREAPDDGPLATILSIIEFATRVESGERS